MYFLSNGSRLYINLISRPKYIWYLLTTSACLLIFSSWLMFLNKPLNKIIKSQLQAIGNLKSELDTNKNHNLNNNDISYNKDNYDSSFERKTLEERLTQLKQEFKEHSGIDQIIKIIEDASKSGLKVKLYDFKPELKKSWYSKYIFELDLIGNFETIIKFIEKINEQNFKLKFFDFVAKSLPNRLINLKMIIQILDINNEIN